jgi:hypothetical protein
MNKDEAHHLLNKRKQGLPVAQHLVNHALLVSGDIGPSCFDGKNPRLESTSMAQGQGTGELFYPFVARDNPGLNPTNERPQ